MSLRKKRVIAVLATLDTKGQEAEFLRDCIHVEGHEALVIDTGVLGLPRGRADIARGEVAAAGGHSLDELLVHPTREKIAPVMAAGATKIVSHLAERGEIDAVLSLGGT